MPLVSKPHHRAKTKFEFKIQIDPKYVLLAQRENDTLDMSYVDVLSTLLYVDGNIDMKPYALIRNLLYALSQYATVEEIKEMIVVDDGVVFDDSKEFLQGKGEGIEKYFELIKAFLETASVQSSIVGEQGLFSNQEMLNTALYQPIEKVLQNKDKEIVADDNDNINNDTINEAQKNENIEVRKKETTKGRGVDDMVAEIITEIEKSDTSSATLAFIRTVVQASKAEEYDKEHIEQYICDMLHGLGLMIPVINNNEINELMDMIDKYISHRGATILKNQIDNFESN